MRLIVRAPRALPSVGIGEPSRHTARAPSLHQKFSPRAKPSSWFSYGAVTTRESRGHSRVLFRRPDDEKPVFLAIEQRDLPAHRCAEPLLEPEVMLVGTLRGASGSPSVPMTCSNSGIDDRCRPRLESMMRAPTAIQIAAREKPSCRP